MNLPRYIAKRTATNGESSQSAMLHIATSAVAVSIAVMVLSLAVMSGFRNSISQLMTDMVSDITLCNPNTLRHKQAAPITDSEVLKGLICTTPNVKSVESFAIQSGVIRTEQGAMGFMLKGVEANSHLTLFKERLAEGEMMQFAEGRRKEILIPNAIAEGLKAEVGDRVEMLFMEERAPHREVFKVCGIYNSALGDVGANLILTDIRNLQKINGWNNDQITGYAIRLYSPSESPQTSDLINVRLMSEYEGDEDLAAISSQQLHANIFGWLETHDVNAVVILTIMLIVAIFNMVTAILILVLDQTRMIGILKSLGMTNRSLRAIFAHRALRILLRGLLWGDAVAIALALVQKHLHVVKLDEMGYFLNEVPISLDGWSIVAVNLLFIAVVMAVVYIATAIVSRIEIAKSIKYE